jgi:DNA-binding GntR family transcriptional regulator
VNSPPHATTTVPRGHLVTEHAEIVEAIQQGDAATATRLLERHMSDSVQRLAGAVRAS